MRMIERKTGLGIIGALFIAICLFMFATNQYFNHDLKMELITGCGERNGLPSMETGNWGKLHHFSCESSEG